MIVKDENNQPKLTIQQKEFNLFDNHDSFFNMNTQQVYKKKKKKKRQNFFFLCLILIF